jgi:hypothetical protein
MTSTTITPIESNGQFWVSTTMEGRETKYGPYPNRDAAEATAARLAAVCRGMFRLPVRTCAAPTPAKP